MLQARKPPGAETYKKSPAFQIMILGCSGGPREDNVTGVLVRSLSTNWQNNSLVAVDAGTMLGGIIRCLELSETKDIDYKGENDGVQMTNGAFEGLRLPHKAAESNGAFIFRHLIQSVLVTHAHLDHCSALAMNSPLIETETAPKTISALPSVIAALKSYIFNGVIWPNLSDEDEGAGLLTYQRLSDGGNPMLGKGIGKGYVESAKGIMTKAMSISHGKSKQKYNPDTDKFERLEQHPPGRVPKQGNDDQTGGKDNPKLDDKTWAAVDSTAFFLLDVHSGAEVLFFGDLEPDSVSIHPRNAKVWREASRKMAARNLRGIFVECSYADAVDDATLYGHMCPRHLIAELSQFAKYVKRERRRRADDKRDEKEEMGEEHPSETGGKGLDPNKEFKRPGNTQSQGGSSPEQHNNSKEKRGDDHEEHEKSKDGSKKNSDDDNSNNPSESDHDNGENNNNDAVPVDDDQKRGQSSSDMEDFTEEDNNVSDQPLKGLKIFIVHIKQELSLPKSARKKIMHQLQQGIEDVGLGCDIISLLAGDVAYL